MNQSHFVWDWHLEISKVTVLCLLMGAQTTMSFICTLMPLYYLLVYNVHLAKLIQTYSNTTRHLFLHSLKSIIMEQAMCRGPRAIIVALRLYFKSILLYEHPNGWNFKKMLMKWLNRYDFVYPIPLILLCTLCNNWFISRLRAVSSTICMQVKKGLLWKKATTQNKIDIISLPQRCRGLSCPGAPLI